MTGGSWTHRLARPLVRPLVGTGITPNHITTARLVTGLMAVAALLPGTPEWTWWGGWLWLLSAFLDRADGELARIGNMATPEGRNWDCLVDNIVNPAFFVAIGVGLRLSALGDWAIPLGLIAGVSLFFCGYWSEALEQRQGCAVKAYTGAFGFDLDDLLYLFAPLAWMNWLGPILVGAAIGATLMAILTGWRLRRLIARQSHGVATEPGTAP
ncbi:CDP-alcohol phosphatidyltransferase family protein [Telmatospirillum sp.]|uniref:CDP-alcohol phosphatidyltransferase family protein n=1 Tax=Telmatospirillum sp. TaxID=2079197 RepID=UPI002840709E|nr:CDP-alcohol phosphatidyltransferase family protein [Telmatospirillum sp.]MDR3440868.1 CDP-alcohol phosphatidyltransferase family protein [Telmatospirillum sp.]